jgi:hypothetical protein
MIGSYYKGNFQKEDEGMDCFDIAQDKENGGQWVKEPSGAINSGEVTD